MQYVDYIEIENFKGIGAAMRVPLANPGVIVGPNNSGKTTVLQALSLWGRAVFEWWDAKTKGRLEKDGSVIVNRLAILDVPIKEARCLWHGFEIENAQGPIPIVLTVGVRMPDGLSRPLKMVFRYRMAEGVACQPEGCADDAALLETAAKVRFGLLHPMSGIASAVSDSTDEPLVAPGRVNVLLGQGQTAQTLRNVCYALWEKSPDDWQRIVAMMRRLFKCDFEDPVFDPGRGSLYLSYRQEGVSAPLEIAMSGRGLQQMLLMLAYLYDRKGQVVLIDEPDAHLEVLRQRQAFAILREIAGETRTQIVIVTHSEIILDEAFETNLVSLAHAHVADLSLRTDIRTTLRNIGVQHYYNAELKKRLLIVEGSTDVAILRAFAAKAKHPAARILDETLFTFYTQDVKPSATMEERVEQMETEGLDYRRYVSTLARLVPDFRALAIFDSDGKSFTSEEQSATLKTLHWSRYEIENYFLTPRLLKRYLTMRGISDAVAAKAIDSALLKLVFSGQQAQVDEFNRLSDTMQAQVLNRIKMSRFAECVFESVAQLAQRPVLLNKGGYYQLIDLIEAVEIPTEVISCLDEIDAILTGPDTSAINVEGGPVKVPDGPVKRGCGPVKCVCGPVNGAINAFNGPVNGLEDLVGPVKLLDIIRRNPGLRKNKLATMTGLSERTIKRYLEEVLSGRVEFRGVPKTGGYYAL